MCKDVPSIAKPLGTALIRESHSRRDGHVHGNGVTLTVLGQVARHPTPELLHPTDPPLSGLFSVLSCGCCVATPASWHHVWPEGR